MPLLCFGDWWSYTSEYAIFLEMGGRKIIMIGNVSLKILCKQKALLEGDFSSY